MGRETSDRSSGDAERDVYIHGYAPEEQLRLGARSAQQVAAFFLPHLRPGMRLLDCGCGPGSVTVGLASVVAPGAVVGIDREQRQVAVAQALAAGRGATNLRFHVANVYALPFPDGVFDAVFANTLLIHLHDPLTALREMRRVLTPTGVAGIADGDFGTWLWEPSTPLIKKAQALFIQAISLHGGDPYVARRYRRLLLDAGFARSEGYGRVSSETRGTPSETKAIAEQASRGVADLAFRQSALEHGWATEAELAAILAEMQAWGDRPDAFCAILDCAAIGWVAGA